MPFFSRPSLGHARSSTSTSSGSSALSTPNSGAQASPLALAVTHPAILENPLEDDDGIAVPNPTEAGETAFDGAAGECGDGSYIVIGDEQIDENPFDPSVSDEVYARELEQRLAAAQSAQATGRHGATPPGSILCRVFSSSQASPPSIRSQRPPPAIVASQSGGSVSSSRPWRMNLRRPRAASVADTPLPEADEEADEDTNGGARGHEDKKRAIVQEPGVVLSGTSPQKWGLLSLQEAQGRSDIVRRQEGFEMSEASPTGM